MNADSVLRWFGIGVVQSETLLKLQVRFIRTLALMGIILSGIGAVVLLATDSSALIRGIVLVFVLINIGLLALMRRGYIQAASIILTASLIAGALVSPAVYVLLGALALISAAALLNNFLFVLANVVVIGREIVLVLVTLSEVPEGASMPSAASGGLVVASALVVVSVATRYFIDQTERAAVQAKEGATLLQIVAETGEQFGKLLSLSEVLPNAVKLISERFGFNHVQIYLMDDSRQRLILSASTALQGNRLYERQSITETASKNVIGQVASTGKLMVAHDYDPIARVGDFLLPNSRVQMAVPIIENDQIIGVLDVQSRQPDAFSLEVEQAIQVLSNLLATSIRNARLFDAQDRTAREAKRLFVETEANLREIQRLNQQLTHAGWTDYLRERSDLSGVSVNNDGLMDSASWTDSVARAMETRQPVREQRDGDAIIAVPVILAGEVIGAIEVESQTSADVENVEMVKAVAQRLALSLDKARLFEESQAATSREQRINEIVAQFQTVANVDDLLRITLEELSRTFGTRRSSIRLGVTPMAGSAGTADSTPGTQPMSGMNGEKHS